MITIPGVTYKMFRCLADNMINIMVISTSEIKISVLIDKKNIKKAIKILHREFKLDRYNHLMEFMRTFLAFCTLTLQVVILLKLAIIRMQ